MSDVPVVNRSPVRRASPMLAGVGSVLLAVSAVGASSQSVSFQKELETVRCHLFGLASSRRDNRRRRKFHQLAKQWREDTEFESSVTEIAMHPGYQAIIGMGPAALPMILADLKVTSDYWFWALKAISNEDPVAPELRGVVEEMKSAWLRWGEEKGIELDDLRGGVDSTENLFSVAYSPQ